MQFSHQKVALFMPFMLDLINWKLFTHKQLLIQSWCTSIQSKIVTCFSCFCFFCNVAVTFKFSRPVFPEHPFTNPSSGKFVMDKSFRLLSNHWKTSHYHLLLLHHHFYKRGLISRFPLNRSLIGMIYHFFWAGTLFLRIFFTMFLLLRKQF